MRNKRRRRLPGITRHLLFAPGKPDPAFVGPTVPRYVLANWDRWLAAKKCGDVWGESRLAFTLRRAGYGVEVVCAGAGDIYRLRRLD